MHRSLAGWSISIGSVAVALIGVAASVTHYLTEPYNPGFAELPLTVALHVIPGGIFLLLAPLQMVARIRRNHSGYHIKAGRVAVGMGLAAGCAAIVMSLIIPFSGHAERLLVTPFALYFVYALCVSLDHARARRIAAHRVWMIRAFAVASSIATMRLIFVPALVLAGTPEVAEIQFLSMASFMLAFAIHCTVAEWWIRHTAGGRHATTMTEQTRTTIIDSV